MLFVQVILGGSAVFGYIDVRYHLVWGVVTFGVLIVATAYAASELGSKSTLFRTGIAAIADYVVQIILGFIALGTNSGVVVVGSSNKRVCARRSRHLSYQLRR